MCVRAVGRGNSSGSGRRDGGGGFRGDVACATARCVLRAALVLLACGAVPQRCVRLATVDARTLFGEESPAGLDADLPIVATAFVQTGSELHYFSDVEYHENLIGGAPVKSAHENEPMLNNQLQFSPKELNFGDKLMGVPSQQQVQVHNPTASSVRFDAISGSTVHFHCSFPEHKTVNPGEATSFDVVFLPRQEGPIENVLFVHSSLGTFTYTVRGRGAANPYRIRPFVGARVPLNGTFVSPVQLHNPHASVLRVTEMYTSGGDLHLELPDTAPDNTHHGSLWEIAPYQTKTVMHAKMFAARERNATAYVKIKTDLKRRNASCSTAGSTDKHFEETLVVPLEVEVTKKRGIFATVDLLDFGLLRASEKSAPLLLEIVSTLEKGIDIESLYVERSEEPNGIYMEFASKPPISLRCGARQQPSAPKAIAKVTFDSKLLRISSGGPPKLIRYKGRIVAESRGGNYNVSVPYIATVYTGTLSLSADETAFHSLLEPPASRGVSLTNDLPFGIAIWNVTLGANARTAFVAKLLTRVVTLSPGESRPVVWLKYLEKKPDGFASHCTLHTNVTTFSVPLVIFNGMLRISLYSIDQTQFDFGTLDAGDSRSIQFAITNENPVPVTVKQLRNALPSMTSLTLLGIEAGNHSVLAGSSARDWSTTWQQGMDFTLPARSFAVFQYTLTAPTDRSVLRDSFVVESDFERTTFPVKYALDEGAVVSAPERLSFAGAFPGKMSSQTLQMYSTFKRDMQVLRMSTLSHDPRVFFESFPVERPPVLKAGQLSSLGRVLFMPSATCTDDCYVGMPLHTADGQWFTYGVKLPQNLAEIDSYLYKRLRRKWLALRAEGKHVVNATVVVDTEEVKHVQVPIQGELVWPRLLTRSIVHFPLTAVGNFTIVNLTLRNPSSQPVVVQLLPLVIYPDAEALVEFFRDELDAPLTEPIEMNETLMFSLRDTELFTLKPDSPVPKLREQLEEVLGIQIPKFTLSMLLQPGMKVRVRIGFLPSDYTLRSSLLLIRNNLTVMEPVLLYGKGAQMDMQVEGRAARSRDPLTFEIQAHHLSDCHNPKRLTHKLFTTLTVKRSFTVVNTGEVAFTVVNISLNNIPCENRGFKVLNCKPFRLAPNESHILDVAYTPDFLMSWSEAALQFYMHMNGTSWLFPLGASVPVHMLSKCHAALPRPPFESLMYYSCVSALVFCLICVIACAYLEADRTVACAIRQQYAHARRVFDLNALDANGLGREVLPPGVHPPLENKSSPRRHVLHYASDANIFARSFWQTANGILWLFSFVWQFRSDQPAVTTKCAGSKQAKAPVVRKIPGESPPLVKPKESYDAVPGPFAPPLAVYYGLPSTSTAVTKRATVKNGRTNTEPSYATPPSLTQTPKSPKMNGDARPTKTKASPTNSLPAQTKLAEMSPSAQTSSKTFALTKMDSSTSSSGGGTSRSADSSSEKRRDATADWRHDSESASDASGSAAAVASPPAAMTAPPPDERLKKKEAIMDGDGRQRVTRSANRRNGASSKSAEEDVAAASASSAKRAAGAPQLRGTAAVGGGTQKRPLVKSLSQRQNDSKVGVSSDLDGELTMPVPVNTASEMHDTDIGAAGSSLSLAEPSSSTEAENYWTTTLGERGFDERSDAGCSDTSAAPEWADGPAIINSADYNADDDFSALSAVSEHLFEAADVSPPCSGAAALDTGDIAAALPPNIATSSAVNLPPQRTARKKPSKSNVKASSASSRSASCSSLDANPPARESQQAPTAGTQQASQSKPRRRQQGSSGAVGQRKTVKEDRKQTDSPRPSAFIQQLQDERRMAEDQFLRNKKSAQEDTREVWPGFNLKLPTLAENLWDTGYGVYGDGMWRESGGGQRSGQWPPTPDRTPSGPFAATSPAGPTAVRATGTPSPPSVGQQQATQPPAPPRPQTLNVLPAATESSVRAFRLNPAAPPFVITQQRSAARSIEPATSLAEPARGASPSSPPLSGSVNSTSGLLDGLMDDPLGLTGSLFGRGANIWATAPRPTNATTTPPTGRDAEGAAETNPAALYWAEKFLADEANDE